MNGSFLALLSLHFWQPGLCTYGKIFQIFLTEFGKDNGSYVTFNVRGNHDEVPTDDGFVIISCCSPYLLLKYTSSRSNQDILKHFCKCHKCLKSDHR
jgi:hypothetical protein